ncbi:MAG TPA: ROK family transcriptional regulator [Polyangiales bacterium]|nr:ROK family transcriptional regulator [Polyangiales bacterium]
MARALQTNHERLGASAIRAQHSRLILNILWKEREISRAELARRTSLSRSTVSAIVNELLDTGLIKEAHAGVSSGGRRPIMLEFQDQSSFIVGIELGATHVSCVLTDLRCNVRASWSVPAPVRDEPEVALQKMTMGVRAVLEAGDVTPPQVLGIGVAVPSPVDQNRPGELLPLIVPKWKGYNIATHLRKILERPVFVDNDANLGALAELWWGVGASVRDLTYIKVATGIGAGLIIDGRIFRGSGGVAGEIGHTSIDPNGPQCVCGLRGCLATLIGTPALLEQAKDMLRASGSNRAPPASIDELVDGALDGDPMSVELIRYAGHRLGVGIANMLNLLNPTMVILGGGIARAQDILLDAVRTTIAGLSLPASIRNAEIRMTGLNEWGIAVGAAPLVLEAALNDPSLFPVQSRGTA